MKKKKKKLPLKKKLRLRSSLKVLKCHHSQTKKNDLGFIS